MILVIDLEATCWDRSDPLPPGEKISEIIEIGVAQLDLNYNFVKSYSFVVKPQFSKVSAFCTSLTGWTPEQIEARGSNIKDALKHLDEKFQLSTVKEWWSYGLYDKKKLSGDKNLFGSLGDLYKIDSPFDEIVHINAKDELSYMYDCRPVGMAKALKMLNMKLDGNHHNGEDDAKNIAKIVKHIMT